MTVVPITKEKGCGRNLCHQYSPPAPSIKI